ncbi:MAG: flagellar biosynthetic protein FliO [Planctomycetes bacterium]|nr:flagellar biosynthetic protein FliO [Planctomycetota bacterium]
MKRRTARKAALLLLPIFCLGGPGGLQHAGQPASPSQPASPAAKVSTAERIGDVLNDAAGSGEAAPPSMTGSFLRLLGWTVVVIALASAALLILKRLPLAGKILNTGNVIRVLGRSALSTRHSIYLIRIANQKLLVVGISGDRMVTLTEISDPAGLLSGSGEFHAQFDSVSQAWPENGREGVEAAGASGSTAELATAMKRRDACADDLLPFQKEVQKIRRLFQGWRSALSRQAPGAVSSERQDEKDDRVSRLMSQER